MLSNLLKEIKNIYDSLVKWSEENYCSIVLSCFILILFFFIGFGIKCKQDLDNSEPVLFYSGPYEPTENTYREYEFSSKDAQRTITELQEIYDNIREQNNCSQ